MTFKMEQCPECEKKMPKHILVKHLAKSHGAISTREPKIDDDYVSGEPVVTLEPTTLAPEPKWYEKWDAGEIGVCAQCKSEWPSKLMGFHLKLEHGL